MGAGLEPAGDSLCCLCGCLPLPVFVPVWPLPPPAPCHAPLPRTPYPSSLCFLVARRYVSGLRWAGGSGRGAALFTASYDGSLRRLDAERGVSGEQALATTGNVAFH